MSPCGRGLPAGPQERQPAEREDATIEQASAAPQAEAGKYAPKY